jgi:hypothetical protein
MNNLDTVLCQGYLTQLALKPGTLVHDKVEKGSAELSPPTLFGQ